jgi:putative acetyltransferase
MLPMSAITFRLENPDQQDIRGLLSASDAYMAALYPAESNHMTGIDALTAPNVRFLVARHDGVCVGCSALILADDASAEIKRMWVEPEARGLKLGRRLLQAIEAEAGKNGIAVLRLETGISQPEAIGLYRSEGFSEIEAFGSYRPDPLSVFMEKRLAENGPRNL